MSKTALSVLNSFMIANHLTGLEKRKIMSMKPYRDVENARRRLLNANSEAKKDKIYEELLDDLNKWADRYDTDYKDHVIEFVLYYVKKSQEPPSMRMFLEFFVKDFEKSYFFYNTVLRMEAFHYEEDFAQLRRGQTQIHLLTLDELPKQLKKEKLAQLAGRTEICLELETEEDVKEELEYIKSTGWDIEDPLTYRPWKKWDFRVKDPEGVYIRISTPTL